MHLLSYRLKFGFCLASLIAASMSAVAHAREATHTVAVTRDELLSATRSTSGPKMPGSLLDEEVPTSFVYSGSDYFRPLNPRTFQAT